MKYLPSILVALLLLTSCAAPPPEKRVDIVLKNTTDEHLTFVASVGIFGRAITVAPGDTWHGWVPRNFVGKEIRIEVKEKKKRSRKTAPNPAK